MRRLIRWGKFNLVGAAGVVVQLAALAFFNRVVPGHYLCATVAAIELTLLHNFAWHARYTWSDRLNGSAIFVQLLRFHLSNGVVSLLGNLVLMWILVQEARVPLLVSNAVAILCCSMLNFVVADRWAFARQAEAGNSRA
jgi:putative flippase GtrA